MDSTHKRSRRPRTVPPPSPTVSSLPPTLLVEVDVPRFRGDRAPLAALAAQVRNGESQADKASAAGRLARQLIKRGIELRDAISLAEKSLSLKDDPELALDLAGWWAEAGDLIRGAALMQSACEEVSVQRRPAILLEVARLYARAEQIHPAAQAAKRAVEIDSTCVEALEMFGSFGFWAGISASGCANAYLQAANLRDAGEEDALAFEDRLRAFEVDPTSSDAASRLAQALRDRGRVGAADEILREHLRRGSAARRAAHHQRVFYSAIDDGNHARGLESALEANLDIELDAARVEEVLAQPAGTKSSDFESFLIQLARTTALGDDSIFAEWLTALCEAHHFEWGSGRVEEIRGQISQVLGGNLPSELFDAKDEQRLRELRQNLASEGDARRRQILRVEIARRECALGRIHEAHEVFEPLLSEKKLPLFSAVLGVVLSGRAREPLSRARALVLLAASLPGAASAVAYAVGAEMLLANDRLEEARLASHAGVDAEPGSKRAMASQALVALHSPEAASAGQLERSLSVLVARSEACQVLCSSASQRGAHRLALTWAARGMALRPGDAHFAEAYLREARLSGDAQKLAECLQEVLDSAAPLGALAQEISRVILALKELPLEKLELLGSRLVSVLGVKQKSVVDAVLQVAESRSASGLLAAVTERQLLVATGSEKAPISLALARQRLNSGHRVPAARALRRAVLQGADIPLVQALLLDFGEDMEPDGALALLETRIELLEKIEPEKTQERAAILREVGAARWDMAQDTSGAIQLWLRAADVEPQQGLELYAHYLHELAGAEVASKRLQQSAQQTEDPARSGRLLGLASREELGLGNHERAFELAYAALSRAPLLTDLLAVAEISAPPHQMGALQELYDILAAASLGSYGERAVHYRAARQLEKRGLAEKALEHACSAFEAVPAEGVAFVLMARLADSTAGHANLVAAIQRVADAASSDDERVRWLAKAAAFADTETLGHKQRADILLRAAQMMPERETLDSLLDSIAHYLADEPEARDELWARFQKVSTEALRHASGAHGAQLNVLFGGAACSHFDQPDYTLGCLIAAVSYDIEVPDYAHLLPMVTQLAGVPDLAGAFLEAVRVEVVEGGPPLGGSLALLAGRVAELLEENEIQTELLVRAAMDFPEDAELLDEARKCAERDQRADLLEGLQRLLPVTEQASFVLSQLDSLDKEEALDSLLELDLEALAEDLRAQVLLALAVRQESMGREVDAALSFRELHELQPQNAIAVKGLEREAERVGNYEELIRILKLRRELSDDAGEVRRLQLRRAAVLETRLGRAAEARELLSEMVSSSEDRSALRMLADSWERTGDHGEAAELWMRVQKVALDPIEADDAAYRAAGCFAESGTPRRAAEALATIESPTFEIRRLGLDVARGLGDDAAIREQLIGLAEVTVGDNKLVGTYYYEAAQLALAAQDYVQAEDCARRAKDAMPRSAKHRLLLAQLSIRRALPASKSAAELILRDLEGTDELTSARDLEVRHFVRAQATRIHESKRAAVELLEEGIVAQGERPLLCLGLADLVTDDPARALSLYESALGGELHGFRGEGEVLLRAGELARQVGDFGRARGFVSAVADDDPLRVRAAKELEEISLEEARARRIEREEKQKLAQEAELAEQADAAAAEEAERRATEDRLRQERLAAEKLAEQKAEDARIAAELKAAEERDRIARKESEARVARETEKAESEARAAAEKVAEEQAAAAREAARRQAEELAEQQAALAREVAEKEAAETLARAQAEAQAAAEAATAKEAAERAAAQKAEDARVESELAAASERVENELAAESERVEAVDLGDVQGDQEEDDAAQIERIKRQAQARESVRVAAREEHLRAARAASEHAELAPPSRAYSEAPSSRRLSGRPSAAPSGRPSAAPSASPQAVPSVSATLDDAFRESLKPAPVPDLSLGAEESVPPGAQPAAIAEDSLDESSLDGIDLESVELHPGDEAKVLLAAEPTGDASPPSSRTPRSTRPPSRHPPKTERSNEELVSLLEAGDVDAGLELLERLQLDRARARDALIVAQHLAALDPGDASLLGRLVTTASRDGNQPLALAVRHVLGAYGSGDPVAAPSLVDVSRLGTAPRGLFDSAGSPLHEALALVWEHASGLYKKDLQAYGVSGIERVPVNAPTPLGELYTLASRVLGLTRTAVFRQTQQEDIAMQVALLSPPAVIVGGQIEEVSPELSFHFGAMLAAASPSHALLFGCSPEEVETLLSALALSFGAGGAGSGARPSPDVTRIAAVLWETIPSRAQRRLSQLCADPRLLEIGALASASRRVLRRAGLVICGHLPTAIDDACHEASLAPPRTLSELAERAHASDAVADLLGFAISPEYAELRFRSE